MEYLHLQNQHEFISVDADVATGDSAAVTLKAAKTANYTIYVQRIVVAVITYAAKTFTFQDSTGSPVIIGFMSIPAAAPTTLGLQDYVLDFGPRGTALSKGKDLKLALSAAGVAARIHVEGYQKLEGAITQ